MNDRVFVIDAEVAAAIEALPEAKTPGEKVARVRAALDLARRLARETGNAAPNVVVLDRR